MREYSRELEQTISINFYGFGGESGVAVIIIHFHIDLSNREIFCEQRICEHFLMQKIIIRSSRVARVDLLSGSTLGKPVRLKLIIPSQPSLNSIFGNK